jgi:hypothetical protein
MQRFPNRCGTSTSSRQGTCTIRKSLRETTAERGQKSGCARAFWFASGAVPSAFTARRRGWSADIGIAAARVTAAAFLAQGAHGLVYGRNIYQHPIPGLVAVMAMIHERASAERTLSIYGGKA